MNNRSKITATFILLSICVLYVIHAGKKSSYASANQLILKQQYAQRKTDFLVYIAMPKIVKKELIDYNLPMKRWFFFCLSLKKQSLLRRLYHDLGLTPEDPTSLALEHKAQALSAERRVLQKINHANASDAWMLKNRSMIEGIITDTKKNYGLERTTIKSLYAQNPEIIYDSIAASTGSHIILNVKRLKRIKQSKLKQTLEAIIGHEMCHIAQNESSLIMGLSDLPDSLWEITSEQTKKFERTQRNLTRFFEKQADIQALLTNRKCIHGFKTWLTSPEMLHAPGSSIHPSSAHRLEALNNINSALSLDSFKQT